MICFRCALTAWPILCLLTMTEGWQHLPLSWVQPHDDRIALAPYARVWLT